VRATGLNHVSVHAVDLDESVRFYEEVLGMERIPTPTFAFPVRWLRLGDLQFHLFVREGDVPAPQFHHVGINVDDFESVYRRARELGIHDADAFSSDIYELPDGSVQMYIRDPAGNLVEIDWPDVETLDRSALPELKKLSETVDQSAEALRSTLYLDPGDDSCDAGAPSRA
jgi:YD repeat-containing protein